MSRFDDVFTLSIVMQSKIHPTYYTPATVTCVCGAVLETGSTIQAMDVEICAHCHPFYTGKKKIVDTTGRVDRFKKMSEKATALKASRAPKKTRAAKKAVETTPKADK
jgi:large subunit ribosomal protein L31